LAASLNTVSARPVALTVSPARLALAAPSSRTLQLSNLGTEQVVVDVTWKSLGRPVAAGGWLRIAPAHIVLPSHAQALLTVRAGPGASPGDHQLLVLMTGRPVNSSRVAVRLRLGVRVRIRAPGRLVRRVAVEGMRVLRLKRKRVLLVSVANRGNVTEQLHRRLTVTLVKRNRVVSRLRLAAYRDLYPGKRRVVALPYAGELRGVVSAVVRLRLGAVLVERRYRLRL
jgi:hypothetical protein